MTQSPLEWAVAGRPLPGERESGDRHLVAATEGGWLLAVADGLGHGPGAAMASRQVVEVIEGHLGMPLADLVHCCHDALRSTRGVALSLVAIEEATGRLCWIGIGNVEGVVVHADPARAKGDYITLRGGVIGYRLPEFSPSALTLDPGDLIVLATDGIDERFPEAIGRRLSAQANADRLLAGFARANDDALVLVARWHGEMP